VTQLASVFVVELVDEITTVAVVGVSPQFGPSPLPKVTKFSFATSVEASATELLNRVHFPRTSLNAIERHSFESAQADPQAATVATNLSIWNVALGLVSTNGPVNLHPLTVRIAVAGVPVDMEAEVDVDVDVGLVDLVTDVDIEVEVTTRAAVAVDVVEARGERIVVVLVGVAAT
jgi:hypothetical protein